MPATAAVTDYPSALDFLLHRINYERTTNIPYRSAEFKLDRMRRLLSLIGDPHLGIKAVHIAGTKGKGSTAAMASSVLQAAGYRTGLYTSPHLQRIEERMVIDGRLCPEPQFASLAAELEAATGRLEQELPLGEVHSGPTFFEITTAMAFLHFARAGVDIAVLEVGLGGRLDSTNVCRPEVCLITSISFDHMRQLGHTLAAIAAEKAGIIKPGVPVVSGVIEEEPRQVIAARAALVAAPLFQRCTDYDFAIQNSEWKTHDSQVAIGDPPLAAGDVPLPPHTSFCYLEPPTSPRYRLDNVRLGLLGAHQAANAAAAIAAVNRLRERGWSISDQAVREGLALARCPARIELVSTSPPIILDVAHNPASIQALLRVVAERFSVRRKVLVFASSKDKDYAGMLRLLLPAFDVVFLTRYVDNPRAMEPEGLLKIAQELRAMPAGARARPPALHAAARPADALHLARRIAGPDGLLCITGSFFLAAELRPVLQSSIHAVHAT